MKRPLSQGERTAVLGRQLAAGIGASHLAKRPPPVPPPPAGVRDEILHFSFDGVLSDGMETNPQSVRRGGRGVVVTLVTDDAASGSSTFQIRLNGTLTGDVMTLASGDTELYHIQPMDIAPRDKLRLACLTAGSGLGDPGGGGGHIQING